MNNSNSTTTGLNESQQLIKFVKDSVTVMRSVMDKVHHKIPYSHRIQFTNKKGRHTSRLNRVARSKHHTFNHSTSLCKVTKVQQPDQLNLPPEPPVMHSNWPVTHQIQYPPSDSQNFNQWLPQIIMPNENANANSNFNYTFNYNKNCEPVYNHGTALSFDQLVSNVNEDEDLSIDNLFPSITSDLFTQSDQSVVQSKDSYEYGQSHQFICL